MKIYFTILFMSIFQIAYSYENAEQKTFNALIEKYRIKNSISYNISYIFKSFDNNDTIFTDGYCELIRNESDSFFNGNFIYVRKDKDVYKQKIYNKYKLYVTDNITKETIQFDPLKNEIFPITGNIDGNFIKVYFLNVMNLKKIIYENKCSFQDSIINNISYSIFKIEYPDDEEYINMQKLLYINKKKLVIDKIVYTAHYKDQTEYSELNLSNIVFNDFNIKKMNFALKQILNTNKIKQYVKAKSKNTSSISKMFPQFEAISIIDNKKIQINKVDKVKVYDFWYSACYNCIKSVSFLNELFNKYSDSIEILGINDIDDSGQNKLRAKLFIIREKVLYPTVIVNKKSTQSLQITGYPTLFLVDKKGIIRYLKIGYSEEDKISIENELKSLLIE